MEGKKLQCDILLPLSDYEPIKLDVPICVSALNIAARLSLPKYMTTKIHWGDSADKFLFSDQLSLQLNYTFYYDYDPSYTDLIKVDIELHNPSITLYPFMFNWFQSFLDNYLGRYKKFKTMNQFVADKEVLPFLS